MRARLAIAHHSIAVVLREVVLKDKPTQMLALSPKGTVPVLQLADGQVIDESLDIVYWALGEPFSERQRSILELNDGLFKQALDRYKYYVRQEQQVEGKSAVDFRDEAVGYLHQYDQYFCEIAPSVFDMTVLPFVRQFRGVDEAWFDALPLPHLHQRLQRFLASSQFKAVMKKYAKWQPEQDEIITCFSIEDEK